MKYYNLSMGLLMCLLLFGCSTSTDHYNTESQQKISSEICQTDNSSVTSSVSFQSGVFYNKNWDEQIGTYTEEDVIPDQSTAEAIAKAIFKNIQKKGYLANSELKNVFFDEVDQIWIVSFWEDKGITYDGLTCSIAMQKIDGKVLRIWFDE